MSRYDLSPEALGELLGDLPAYRARQVWEGLYIHGRGPDELSTLHRELRLRLAGIPELASGLEPVRRQSADRGTTTKWLLRLDDGAVIETVLMLSPRHATVCVSSQAGCAMGCTFCATGDAGYRRQLCSGEIVEQVVLARRTAADDGRRLTNVVFMGMGEPLANLDALEPAIDTITGDLGLGARHLTVSTVGVVPGILRLANNGWQVNLAVSLHAANDELRDRLVPLNRRYPLESLFAACREHIRQTKRRLSFEWALIDGVNDRASDAQELARAARALRAHVNLIPLNPTAGGLARALRGSPRPRVLAFRRVLLDLGVNATIRRTRGQAIDAACGQLAGSSASAAGANPTTTVTLSGA